MTADGIWAAAAELGRLRSEAHAAKKAAQRDARNARRRAAYRAQPKTPRRAPVVVEEPADAEGCYCGSTPMPPCGWCESGGAS